MVTLCQPAPCVTWCGGVARSTPYVVTRSGFDPRPYNEELLKKDTSGSAKKRIEIVNGLAFAPCVTARRFTLALLKKTSGSGDDRAAALQTLLHIADESGFEAVLATLWPVNDPATAAFLAEFHRPREGGVSKAEALRQTQRAFLAGEITPKAVPAPTRGFGVKGAPSTAAAQDWRHPYFWAPFVLLGNLRHPFNGK